MFVLDASVAMKWYVEEPGRPAALALLAGEEPFMAPDLILAEVGNAMWKSVRRGLALAGQARLAVESLAARADRLVPIAGLAPAAVRLALDHDHPIYDCFYIALARRESAPLITADARLVQRFAAAAEIRLLGA